MLTNCSKSVPNFYKKPSIVWIFDDGYNSHINLVAPLFNKYKIKCDFAIICSSVKNPKRLSEGDIIKLYEMGFQINSHSYNHIKNV